MIKTIDPKRMVRRKISTAITATSPELGTFSDQLEAIMNWSDTIPHVMVAGQAEPAPLAGVRWMKTSVPNPPMRNVLNSYLVPGNEVCVLASPTIHLGGRQADLMDFMAKERMELSWMAFAFTGNEQTEAPDLFVMSKSVVAHVTTAMPINLTFANNEWKVWLHEWAKKFMPRHRYFDATSYGIAIRIEIKPDKPVLNAYDLREEMEPEKELIQTEKKPSKRKK